MKKLYDTKEDKLIAKLRKELMLYMAATGQEDEYIRDFLQITDHRFVKLRSDPDMEEAIEAKRRELYGDSYEEKWKSMIPDAQEILRKTMMSETEKASTRITAAEKILDRGLGKPSQEIQHSGGLSLTNLMDYVKDVTPSDQLEGVNEEIKALSGGLKVGQRGEEKDEEA